jgi:hypothetical protein
MTTRRSAETLLFDVESTCQIDKLESTVQNEQFDKPEATAEFPKLDSKGALSKTDSAQTKDGREAGEEFPHVEGRWEIPKVDKLEAAGQIDQLDRLEAKGELTETVSLQGNGEIHQYPTAQTKDGRESGSQSRKSTRVDAEMSTRVEIRGDVSTIVDKTQMGTNETHGTQNSNVSNWTQNETPVFNTGLNVNFDIDKPERRRICATCCPRCRGWVEVRLRPVRLHCTRCGLEARP